MKLELQTISKKLSPRLKAYKPARADVENFAQNLEFYLNHIDSKETEENLKTHFMGLLKPTYQPSHTIEQYGDIGLVAFTFRSLNSFMRPFVRMPRGFCYLAMSDVGAGYKSH